jgi:hypothetical protein
MSAEETMRDALCRIMLRAPMESEACQIAIAALIEAGLPVPFHDRQDHCTGATTSDDRGQW